LFGVVAVVATILVSIMLIAALKMGRQCVVRVRRTECVLAGRLWRHGDAPESRCWGVILILAYNGLALSPPLLSLYMWHGGFKKN
jgi:hypothetical protein